MIIGLASPRIAVSIDDGLQKVKRLLEEASAAGAQVVCFPEAYLPGLRGQDFAVCPFSEVDQEKVLSEVTLTARKHRIATILGMEKLTRHGRENVAVVIDRDGNIQGYQTKNQLDPSEDPFYISGSRRHIFEIDGVKFGIVICHEGWRYPETVRWAATRGAKIVFHPQLTGSDSEGVTLQNWGDPQAPYYEKAMLLRSLENTIYFASVNYALRFPESATSLIDPSGRCIAHLPYGTEGVLVQEIQPEAASGFLAKRFAPEKLSE